MWPFSSRTTRRSKSAHRGAAVRKLCLETLEDRCLLNAGALDPTFGNGAGYVTTSTSPYGGGAHSALIQPNGDIIAVGSAITSSDGSNHEFAVERYNPDGSLDTSFGSGGIAVASFGSLSARGAHSALYPAGTANAGEIVQEGAAGNNQALARYNTNGTLDTTFGTGGEVVTAYPGMSSIYWQDGGVVVTSTGQIVALSDTQSGGQFVLARYNSNGSLDTTFGQGGHIITNVSGGDPDWNSTLLQQPNGDLLVSYTQGPNGTYNNDQGGVWDLYRFNANGTLDTSFGNQGIVNTTAPGGPYGMALYPNAGTPNDGQIVLVGQAGSGPVELARYNANGSLDTTFGSAGLMQTGLSMGPVWQAALDANGRIVVTSYGTGSTTQLARFNLNGTPDTTFGSGGLVTTTFGSWSQGLGVAVYPNTSTTTDGDIVVVGATNNGTKTNVLVARYLGQATGPYFTITGSTSLTAGRAGTFTISVLNPDGSADTGYSGTVQITSSDSQAVLPANFAITGGTATFSATIDTAGVQSLTATDATTPGISGSDASIQVIPSAATHFSISGPSSEKASTAFSITVTALDAYGNVATGYLGTVKFTDSVSGATLPNNYTFTAADGGVHTFTGLKLKTKGKQTITVTDTSLNTVIGTLTITAT